LKQVHGLQKQSASFIVLVISIVMLALVFGGCRGKGQTKGEKPAEQLAEEGMDAYNRKKYRKALDSFEQLKDWYPFSKYAILAELKVADSRFALKEFNDAFTAYNSFASLHPRNEAMPYVTYQMGMCYFKQMEPVDQDQVSTQKALDYFQRVVGQYPESPYAVEAADRVRACQKNLAGQEMYVGHFYLKSKQYKAALIRFENVLSKYPSDLGFEEEATRYINKCREALKDEDPS
jgi:outer membrane protein assembly factor BamD